MKGKKRQINDAARLRAAQVVPSEMSDSKRVTGVFLFVFIRQDKPPSLAYICDTVAFQASRGRCVNHRGCHPNQSQA